MPRIKKAAAIFILFCICINCGLYPALAASSPASAEDAIADTGAYLLKTIDTPQCAAVGGEWAVIGLARSGCSVPQAWYDKYYENLSSRLAENKGILSDRKYTEYSRAILALTAMGRNPSSVGGYSLLEKLGDYNKVVWQGINGPVYALLALDAGGYAIPVCKDAAVQTTRELLLNAILSKQLTDGGFSLSGTSADPELTAMVLQALAPYREKTAVAAAVGKALSRLSALQGSDGGFPVSGTESAESAIQALVALTALGIDPDADTRFLKNGTTVLDNLMTFYVSGGGFRHTQDDEAPDGMATEQGLYALAAYQRYLNHQKSLYDMSDVRAAGTVETGGMGLPGKNEAVKASAVVAPGKTFDDIAGFSEKASIEALASRGIINGVGGGTFAPAMAMTRAEFAALVVRALGLTPITVRIFQDVSPGSWYASYVGTAYTYKIVYGTSSTAFSPGKTITREEAAVMVARAAGLCGLSVHRTEAEIRDTLAQFADYKQCAVWSGESLSFCYDQGILPQTALSIRPKQAATRAEIAEMIYRMLQKAALL